MEGYVIVEARSVNNGINTLSGSGTAWGNEGEGEQPNTYWLYWSYTTDPTGTYLSGGYTGIDWYWDNDNNYLSKGWNAYTDRGNYSNDLSGFQKWLVDTNPTNLNSILGAWPSETKQAFIDTYYTTLRQSNCLRMF